MKCALCSKRKVQVITMNPKTRKSIRMCARCAVAQLQLTREVAK